MYFLGITKFFGFWVMNGIFRETVFSVFEKIVFGKCVTVTDARAHRRYLASGMRFVVIGYLKNNQSLNIGFL